MKQIIRLMMVAVMAMATVGFAACERVNDDPQGGQTPVEPTYETLAGTEWEGTYATYDQYPGYTSVPITIHWTVDFLQDGRGEIMYWFESQAYDPDTYSWQMSYTFANNAGVITDADGTTAFTCDPYNRTMDLTLTVGVQYEEGGTVYTYGGPVTLHQVR